MAAHPSDERLGGGSVMTVLGPVEPSLLGRTLIHEHLHMDARPMLAAHAYHSASTGPFTAEVAAEARWNPGVHADNYDLTDEKLIVAELEGLRQGGAGTIVDVTPVELGRDPAALQRISRGAGLHVVMGAGHYLHLLHDDGVRAASEGEIAERLIAECVEGVGDSGVRPGIIGEIGTSDPVHPDEQKVVRGAARAARATGRSLSIHLHPWARTGLEVLDVALSVGLDADRVILGHMNTAHSHVRYLHSLLERGALLAFDLFGFDHSLLGLGRYPPSDADVADVIVGLVDAGHARQLLISCDVGVRTRLRRYGGWGYEHLLTHVVPLLTAKGVDDDVLEQLLVDTPARVLTVAVAAAEMPPR